MIYFLLPIYSTFRDRKKILIIFDYGNVAIVITFWSSLNRVSLCLQWFHKCVLLNFLIFLILFKLLDGAVNHGISLHANSLMLFSCRHDMSLSDLKTVKFVFAILLYGFKLKNLLYHISTREESLFWIWNSFLHFD